MLPLLVAEHRFSEYTNHPYYLCGSRKYKDTDYYLFHDLNDMDSPVSILTSHYKGKFTILGTTCYSIKEAIDTLVK